MQEDVWQKLLQEIEKGNVALLLGKELLSLKINGESILLSTYIIKKLCERLRIAYFDGLNFSSLSYESMQGMWSLIKSDPYRETKRILEEIPKDSFENLDLIRQLLEIDRFNIILTTSFGDVIKNVLCDLWGNDNVKSYQFQQNGEQEDVTGYERHALYYLFGHISDVRHECVLDDEDLLKFIHDWFDKTRRPQKLSSILSQKYLLAIGCNYPNWLFRFFFYSIKNNVNRDSKGLLADTRLKNDYELSNFLERINVEKHDDSIKFVRELLERWKQTHRNADTDVNLDDAVADKDYVFISYAHEDHSYALQLAKDLKGVGIDVWFDDKDLNGGDEYEKKIRQEVAMSKAFVAVLSNHCNERGPRFYKREWAYAENAKLDHYPHKFVIPVAIDTFDYSKRGTPVGDAFFSYTVLSMSEDNFLKKLVREIRSMF